MVVLATAPCRTQRRHRLLRHRLDIRAESSDHIPPEKEKEEPDKGRRPGRWRLQETESICVAQATQEPGSLLYTPPY